MGEDVRACVRGCVRVCEGVVRRGGVCVYVCCMRRGSAFWSLPCRS